MRSLARKVKSGRGRRGGSWEFERWHQIGVRSPPIFRVEKREIEWRRRADFLSFPGFRFVVCLERSPRSRPPIRIPGGERGGGESEREREREKGGLGGERRSGNGATPRPVTMAQEKEGRKEGGDGGNDGDWGEIPGLKLWNLMSRCSGRQRSRRRRSSSVNLYASICLPISHADLGPQLGRHKGPQRRMQVHIFTV